LKNWGCFIIYQNRLFFSCFNLASFWIYSKDKVFTLIFNVQCWSTENDHFRIGNLTHTGLKSWRKFFLIRNRNYIPNLIAFIIYFDLIFFNWIQLFMIGRCSATENINKLVIELAGCMLVPSFIQISYFSKFILLTII